MMNNKMLKGLVEAGAVKAFSIIANGATIHAEILTHSGDKKFITTQARTIKTWGTIDSAAKWLKRLGLGTMTLEVGKWLTNQKGEYGLEPEAAKLRALSNDIPNAQCVVEHSIDSDQTLNCSTQFCYLPVGSLIQGCRNHS
jgi:hypothetical protein